MSYSLSDSNHMPIYNILISLLIYSSIQFFNHNIEFTHFSLIFCQLSVTISAYYYILSLPIIPLSDNILFICRTLWESSSSQMLFSSLLLFCYFFQLWVILLDYIVNYLYIFVSKCWNTFCSFLTSLRDLVPECLLRLPPHTLEPHPSQCLSVWN